MQPASVRFDDFGLSAFTISVAEQGSLHTHLEVEVALIERGSFTYLFAGREEEVGVGEPVMFWGAIPHRVRSVEPNTVCHIAQVPIASFLSWVGPSPMVERLFHAAFVRETLPPQDVALDRASFSRWPADLSSQDPQMRSAAALEIQARVLRFTCRTAPSFSSANERPRSATLRGVAEAMRFVAAHFAEPITIDDISESIGWHRDHLMASFRKLSGITLWDYVTRSRLAEAQRLLTATDLSVLTVCGLSGFSSTSRMYSTFARHCGLTPAAYRRNARRVPPP